MKLKKMLGAFCGIAAFLVFSPAHSGVIAVDNVTASSTFHTYSVSNLINGSGLVGDLHSGDWPTKWLSDEVAPNTTPMATLLFDFGSINDVGSSYIWNYGPGCCGFGRSTKNLVVESSLDGVVFDWVGEFTLTNPPQAPFAADVVNLNVSARYVRFNLNSNYGDPQYIGLSEVQFRTASQMVPEPAGLLLLGVGLLGAGMSRKVGPAGS